MSESVFGDAYEEIPAVATTRPGTEEAETAVRQLLGNLGRRKEFFSLRHDPDAVITDSAGSWNLNLPGMQLHGAQLFVQNLFNPSTPYPRIAINWTTGTGKSIAVISIGREFVRLFRQMNTNPELRPTVMHVGFTKSIIMADMLKYPELGFVSIEEADSLRRLRTIADLAGPSSQEAKHLSGFLGVLRRRITDRARGGYYLFYGYKELANELFVVTRKGIEAKFNVQSLWARDADETGPSFNERLIVEVRNGNLTINEDLLNRMKGGLVIADEIHNTYNMLEKNNYGVALQYMVDVLGIEAPRAVYMSATLMTGSAAEVVDFLNLLIPRDQLPGGAHLRRSDFFAKPRRDEKEPSRRAVSQLLPGALERIGHLSAGRVVFLLDTDTASYPQRTFVGESMPGIAYLRFTPCPMSQFHLRTLAQVTGDSKAGTLPPNAYSLYDLAFPNPAFENVEAATATGLYDSTDTIARLASAPAAWRDANGVIVLKGVEAGVSPGTSVVSGAFLRQPGLANYSAKHAELVRESVNFVKTKPGKIMIYHQRVRMSGILFIQEALRMNGFSDEISNPTDSVMCSVCGITRGQHATEKKNTSVKKTAVDDTNLITAQTAHEYQPARFVMAHSDIDRAVMDRSLARFNATTNANGYQFRVLAGSKIIREGHNVRAVRKQIITSLPTDIPTLIQIFGRVVRKDSHSELPPEERNVEITILVSTDGDRGGPELVRYADKMREYLVIQEVDRSLRRYAVDGFASYGRLLSADPTIADRATIDSLPYRPVVELSSIRHPLTVATFEAYGHGEKEVRVIVSILRVIFSVRPVWKYADLWELVRSGVVRGVGYDASLFSEGNYALALRDLRRPFGEPPVVVVFAEPFYVLCPMGADGRAVMDVGSYRQAAVATPTHSRVKLNDYLRGTQQDRQFDVAAREFVARYFGETSTPLEFSLVEVDGAFHIALMKKLIQAHAIRGQTAYVRTASTAAVLGSPEADAATIKMYRRFRILVTVGDIKAHPAAAAIVFGHMKGSLKSAPGTVIGLVQHKSVEVWSESSDGGSWIEIPHTALGIGRRGVENNVVVGFVTDESSVATQFNKSSNDHLFKIRPPIQVLRAQRKQGALSAKKTDIRSLARGAVCETRPREELTRIITRLSTLASTQKTGSAASLCATVKHLLLDREADARAPADGMMEGVRWVYTALDRPPVISVAVR